MAESSSKSKGRASAPLGHTRVRVTYSRDGFRGVKDLPDDVARIMIDEHRAHLVDADTPLGEDEPAGEMALPLGNATNNTSSSGTEGSATAHTSTASSTATGGR